MNPILYLIRLGGRFTLFFFRKWYIVITILILLPSIISSIQEGIEQKNPLIPIYDLGMMSISADQSLYDELQNNTDEIIPNFKPDNKILNKIDYWGRFAWNLGKRVFVNLWMIIFNFMVFYWFFGLTNKSKEGRNLLLAFLTMVFLQIFIRLLLLVITNDIEIPGELNLYSKMWFIIKFIMPFKGVYSLIKFIISSIV